MSFEELVQRAERVVSRLQAKLPLELRALAAGVAVHYESEPDDSVLAEGIEPDTLGLFTGHPHGTEFSHADPAPPQILLYLDNIWDFAEGDPVGYTEEVRLTYLHELGHYFGWDENDLAARGLD